MAAQRRVKVSAKSGRTRPAAAPHETYDLVLFISGATERSRSALADVKALAEGRLRGRYRLSVVDLRQQPELARAEGIFATPTLLKRSPPPPQRIVGDLSDEDRVILGLGLVPVAPDRSRQE